MKRTMIALAALALFLSLPGLAVAQDAQEKIQSAMSAAPASIAKHATVMDWDQTVLREGTSDWVCLPDIKDTPGNDPMCLDEPWVNWVHSWMTKQKPTYTRMGFGYMLQGGTPSSNTDPYAEGPTPDNEWMDEEMPHIMVIVPDSKVLEGLPTKPDQGGPWVMWKGTPYAHVMVPTPKKGM